MLAAGQALLAGAVCLSQLRAVPSDSSLLLYLEILYRMQSPSCLGRPAHEFLAINAERAERGIDSYPPGSCFPYPIKKHFVLNKTGQSIYIIRGEKRKGNSFANSLLMGLLVVLDTLFTLRTVLDSSLAAISGIDNLQLLFI